MLENAKAISFEKLNELQNKVNQDKVAKVMQNACSKSAISQLVYVPSSKVGNYHQFEINLKTLPVANQKASGRCWIFAGTNVLREIVAKKINADNFELSQNFVAFYDKFEKINYALESIIDLIDKDSDDRTFKNVTNWPVGDGGQWDMFKSLIKKYGCCPKNVMDETYQSSNTRDSGFIINTMIRKFAAAAQKLHKDGKDDEMYALKDETLEKLYRLLVISFGNPIEKFDFEYVDKDGNYHLEKDFTPKSFYEKYVAMAIDDYVSIINAPTKDKPFYATFTVDYIGNVIGGDPIFYLNLPMNEFKDAVVRQLKDNEVVWFGSDCGKFSDRENGVWDPNQFDYESAFDTNVMMDKADMLDYGQSAMNHAMVITGVSFNNDKPTKWKIENSWGDACAFKGYYTATDAWFDDFVFQAVVNVKNLTEKQKECLKKAPIHLNPWDPMGTLAD